MNADELFKCLKVAAYHMEEIAHGLRSGELNPDDASIMLDEEARISRCYLDANAPETV